MGSKTKKARRRRLRLIARQRKSEKTTFDVWCFYHGGLHMEYDALLRKIADRNGGRDVGSGMMMDTRERDVQFAFDTLERAVAGAIALRAVPGLDRVTIEGPGEHVVLRKHGVLLSALAKGLLAVVKPAVRRVRKRR